VAFYFAEVVGFPFFTVCFQSPKVISGVYMWVGKEMEKHLKIIQYKRGSRMPYKNGVAQPHKVVEPVSMSIVGCTWSETMNYHGIVTVTTPRCFVSSRTMISGRLLACFGSGLVGLMGTNDVIIKEDASKSRSKLFFSSDAGLSSWGICVSRNKIKVWVINN